MNVDQLERTVLLASGALVLAAAVVMAVGVSPAEVPPAEDYPVERPEDQAPPPKSVRKGPTAPQTPPAGAMRTLESGLGVWDIEVGTGPQPAEEQVVQIEYTAWIENGMAIESTSSGLDPMRFVVGRGLVPKGLEEGVRTMRVGGVRQLVAPAELAYGEEGVLNRVPANAVLTYEVELVDVWNVPEAPPVAADWSPGIGGVRIAELEVGTGRTVGDRSAVRMDYAMWANGTLVGTSFDDPRPMRARLGREQLLPAWESGLRGLRVGGRRLIEIPPELAYGGAGQGEIPANATLLLEVRLHRVL